MPANCANLPAGSLTAGATISGVVDTAAGVCGYDTNGQPIAVTSTAGDPPCAVVIQCIPPSCLGDWVWDDLNLNGLQDAGEPGLSNVVVHLLACSATNVLASTATSPEGYYLFCGMALGSYRVRVEVPNNYVVPVQNVGTNDCLDSDLNPATAITDCVTLPAGTTNLCVDIGLRRLVCAADDELLAQVTISWTNAAGGDWNVAANWSPNRLPLPSDVVAITNCGTYTVTVGTGCGDPAGLILGSCCGTQTLVVLGQPLPLLGPGRSLITANGTLELRGGTIIGASVLTVEGTLNWTAGTISGGATVIAPGGTLNLSGTTTKVLENHSLVNNGTWNWSGGTLSGLIAATITNHAVLNLQADVTLANSDGSAEFYNLGTVRKTGLGTTTFGLAFYNAGLLEVQTGWFSLSGGGGSTGLFNLAAGAELSLLSGYTLGHGATIAGLGTFRFNATGTLAVTGTVGVRNLVWQQGAANLLGTLNVTNLTAASGNLSAVNGPGAMNIYGLATLSSGPFTGSANVTVYGTMNWSSGTIGGAGGLTIVPGGTLNLSSTATKYLEGRALNNAGTCNWSGGNLLGLNAAVLSNRGTWNVQTDATLGHYSGPLSTFHNAGLFRKTAGAGTTYVTLLFNNLGTVDVQSGYLSFNAGGTSSGQFLAAAGAEIDFLAPHTLGAGSRLAGAGLFRINQNGTITGNGTVTVNKLVFDQGAFAINGTLNVTNLTVTSGNPITVNGPGAMNVYGLFTLSSSPFTGSASVTVCGTLNWVSSTIGGSGALTIAPGGTLNLTSTYTKYLEGRTLSNAGTCNWVSGSLLGINAPVIANSGTWNVQSDFTLGNYSGPLPTFNNSGTVRKTAGIGTTTLSMTFNNTGLVDAQSGNFYFTAGGAATGSFKVAQGYELGFTAAYTFNTNSTLTGLGWVRFNSAGTHTFSGPVIVQNLIAQQGACALNGTLTVTNLDVTSGNTITVNGPGAMNVYGLFTLNSSQFAGSANVVVYGTLNWYSGTLIGPGPLTIAPGGTLNLTSTYTKYLEGRTLSNAGTCNWASGSLLGVNAPVIANSGTWNVQSDFTLGNYTGALPTFNNSGTLRKTAGPGTTTVNMTFNNTGAVDVQSGLFAFSRGYNQTAGQLNFGLSGPGAFGRVSVTGAATFGGALSVNLLVGYFPLDTASFAVMTFGSRGGTISDHSGLQLGNGRYLDPLLGSTTLTLQMRVGAPTVHHFAFSAIPSPQVCGVAFPVTITAMDAGNNPVTNFTGTANLSTTAGVISPNASGSFVNGVATRSVMVTLAGNGKTITATKSGGSETGTSAAFNVITLPSTLSSLKRLANGDFEVKGSGLAGLTYTIQASTDLLNWITVGTATADANGRYVFTDVDADQFSKRFYRAVSP